MNTITIEGTEYIIEKSETAHDLEKQGYKNTARMMWENLVECQMVLRRPQGKKLYHCNAFANATYSKPFAVA